MVNELKLDQTTAAMVALAEAGIPTDVQELLVRGDPDRGIAPGAITKALNTRPAAPVEGLETVAWRHPSAHWAHKEYDAIVHHCLNDGPKPEALVTRSQAEAIIAAERARYHALEEIAAGLVERTDKAEADNAALTSRVKELKAENERLRLNAATHQRQFSAANVRAKNMTQKCHRLGLEAETLETQLTNARKALTAIAEAPAWGFPEKWETTPAEVRQLARAALEAKP